MKKAFIQLHIAVFLAGFTAILGKLIQLNEGLLVFYRLLIAIVVLGVLLKAKKLLPRLPVKDMLKIALVGVMVAFHWVAFYGSIKYANVSVALVCFSATGFFTALLEPLILRRKSDMVEVILGLMVIAGIIIVFDFHPHYKLGILFGIAAAVGSAIFPILNKQLLLRFTPKVLTWYEFFAGFIFLCMVLPVYFIFFPPAYFWPSAMAENIGFFWSYQINWMYWRYFMWNFAGKQNDIQGINMGNVRDGNWKTGIGFFDKIRLGDQNSMPDTLKHNKANNKLFALPFILGLLGLLYQIKKDKRDFIVVGLLFFFTGFAISIYLNQAGNQPRERDYAFVGSFYAFAIWIGLGFYYVRDFLMQYIKKLSISNYIAGLLCLLLVPVLMASQEWDDHDRSHKTLARDLAIDYLESCAPNAILITFGDNDTYPLWYAQEVQGIRRDIRVINSSLLGTDWYINQLRYKVNQSDPIDPIWTPEEIVGANRDVIYAPERIYGNNTGMINQFLAGAGIKDPSQPMDLYTMMKDYAGSDDPKKTQTGTDGSVINIFPVKRVSIPVDEALVRKNGTVNANDTVVSQVVFDIPKGILYKNETAILNIIAANKWKRPIYFTSAYGELGFGDYLRQDGLTYRLVPVKNSQVNEDWVVNKMMNKFVFGNADKPGVYFDEENRRHLNSIRLAYAGAARNLAENGRKEDARKLLNKCDQGMLEENMPIAMASRSQQHNQISMQMYIAANLSGDSALAKKFFNALKKDMEQQAAYYQGLPPNKRDGLEYEEQRNDNLLRGLMSMEQQFKMPLPPSAETTAPIKTQPVLKPADSNK